MCVGGGRLGTDTLEANARWGALFHLTDVGVQIPLRLMQDGEPYFRLNSVVGMSTP